MSTSTILFLSAAGCGLLFGVLAVYAQVREGIALGAVRWTAPVVLWVGCTAFGGLAYLIDSGLAATTLYEIDADGSGPDVPEAIAFDIPVEHPGALHDVLVAPKTDGEVTVPAQVRVQLRDPAGQLLVDESRTLEPRCEDPPTLCTWDGYSAEFTPATAGTHELIVTLDTPDVPVLHVRVGDEDKTDGQRAPGY